MTTSGGNLDQSTSCGLPPRPPTASTPVWKHLLRGTTGETPKSLNDIPIIAPPMAALDKNATSMRVLLHDTHANFERFTSQVGNLFETIQETKNDLKTMQSLFQRDRETLTGDIVDLVNRSQREIQKSIGTPLQSDTFADVCKTIYHRLDGLDQRLEAMNSFNQTHSQALQTQMHTVQLILDKQGSMLSAVTPILPFLQNLPPLIEALRTIVTEKLRDLATSLNDRPQNGTSPISLSKRKRTLVEHGIPSLSPSSVDATKSPGLSRKKSRVMDSDLNAQPLSNSTDSGQRTTPLRFTSSSSPPIPVKPCSRTRSNIKPQEIRIQNLATPRRDRNNFVIPPLPPSTSRRRLNATGLTSSGADHHFAQTPPPLLPVATELAALCSRTHVSSHGTDPSPKGRSNVPSFFGTTPAAIRPPRMLRVHASIAARSRSNSAVTIAESRPPSMANTTKDSDTTDDKAILPKGFENEEPSHLQIPNLLNDAKVTTSETAINRINRSDTRVFNPLTLPPSPLMSRKGEKEAAGNKLTSTLTLLRPPPDVKKNKEVVVRSGTNRPTAPSASLKGKNIAQPPGTRRLKERVSPSREGRRFIPLIDSDDDEENIQT